MTQINPHIHFNRTCKEAMTFYKECLGGELVMQTVGETPMKGQMPGGTGDDNKIMHASLKKGDMILLMASDMMDPSTFIVGDNITLSLNCSSEDDLRTFFTKLSAGGKVVREVQQEFWGALFGMCTDKFGIDWMLNYNKPKK
jgi:PhnB protein